MMGYPNICLLLALKMVRDEVNFWKDTLLKKLNSRRKRGLGSRFSVDTLG